MKSLSIIVYAFACALAVSSHAAEPPVSDDANTQASILCLPNELLEEIGTHVLASFEAIESVRGFTRFAQTCKRVKHIIGDDEFVKRHAVQILKGFEREPLDKLLVRLNSRVFERMNEGEDNDALFALKLVVLKKKVRVGTADIVETYQQMPKIAELFLLAKPSYRTPEMILTAVENGHKELARFMIAKLPLGNKLTEEDAKRFSRALDESLPTWPDIARLLLAKIPGQFVCHYTPVYTAKFIMNDPNLADLIEAKLQEGARKDCFGAD